MKKSSFEVSRPRAIVYAVLFWAAVTLSGTAGAANITGTVVKVTDGDTVTVLTADRTQHTIRLYGIDAPERAQPYGQKAKQALAGLIYKEQVQVVVTDTDRYGRLIGRIEVDGRDVNLYMVAAGHAWVYRRYTRDNALYRAEDEAKARGVGLWALQADQVVAPWEWRKAGKSAFTSGDAVNADCGGKRYCREMVSCEEAMFYLNTCDVMTIDGDRDGLPCEALCS